MKKMLYTLPDGNEVGGDTYEEVVRSMASYKFGDVRSLRGYRRETERRTMEMYGVKVDSTSNESFVKSMVEAGLLTVIP